jgi:hypothetical protein
VASLEASPATLRQAKSGLDRAALSVMVSYVGLTPRRMEWVKKLILEATKIGAQVVD